MNTPCLLSVIDHLSHALGSSVGDSVILETHISYVLLSGHYAYKFKKPLKLDFLDFSTLASRRKACEDELRLNRRLAPDLYLSVLPITGSELSPEIDGGGTILEYCVKMRRFDTRMRADAVLARHELEPDQLEDFGKIIGEFHLSTTGSDGSAGQVPVKRFMQQGDDNFIALTRMLANTPLTTMITDIAHRFSDLLAQHVPLLERRATQGYIRDCHGDLHLANLVVLEQRLTAFDCIEFNPDYRWIDVMSEVAFLVMDLSRSGAKDLAQRFLNRYLDITGDFEGLSLLSLFAAHRALVRAKVTSLETPEPETIPEAQYRRIAEYLQVAQSFLAPPIRPYLIAMHGFSGSGKSWLSADLASALGAIRLRSDIERKRLDMLSETASESDEILYSDTGIRRTYERLGALAAAVLQSGYSVVVDATCLKAWQRQVMRDAANTARVPFWLIDVHADLKTLEDRIEQRARQGKDPSDANRTVMQHQLRSHDPLTPDEVLSTITVDNSVGTSIVEQVAGIKSFLQSRAAQ